MIQVRKPGRHCPVTKGSAAAGRWRPPRTFLATATAAAAVAALSVAAAAGCSAAPGPAATSARRALPAYTPIWAVLTSDGGSATADLGPAPAQAPVSARVYLAGRDPSGLSAFAAAVSDPHSRLFRRYLTPAQVQRQFGPTRPQVAGVESWLTAAGMRVTGATAHYIAVTGTVSEAAAAFGAGWHSYRVAGRTQQAPPPGARLTAPARVSSAVLTVVPAQTGLPGSSGTAAAATPASPRGRRAARRPRPHDRRERHRGLRPSPRVYARSTSGRTSPPASRTHTAVRCRMVAAATPRSSCAPHTGSRRG
jgi:Pro-kumamolisin, activation domain